MISRNDVALARLWLATIADNPLGRKQVVVPIDELRQLATAVLEGAPPQEASA